MTRVLVTDSGRGSAMAIIRSLGRRGLRVIAADSSPRSAGFRSRYVSDTVVYPRPEDHSGEVVDVLDVRLVVSLGSVPTISTSEVLEASASNV